jgi:hypothetical protein
MDDTERDTQIRYASADAMVGQLLVTGLMRELLTTGVPKEVFERVFEHAADLATISSYTHGPADGGQSVRVLQGLERLRKAVITD